MQTTKEYTHKLLLETARRAFFKKGFKAVSMREISKLSGIGLSNIYNYYPCKDDLLADVLHPLLEAMNSMLEIIIARRPFLWMSLPPKNIIAHP